MLRSARTLAVTLVLSISCQAARPDRSHEAAALLETDRAWAAAAAAGDAAKLSSFWADDAVNLFPGRPVAHGLDEIRALVRQNRSRPGFALSWEPNVAEVAASGDLGYTWGPFRLSVDGTDGRPVVRQGNYLCIWRKQSDGAWKCTVESSVFSD